MICITQCITEAERSQHYRCGISGLPSASVFCAKCNVSYLNMLQCTED